MRSASGQQQTLSNSVAVNGRGLFHGVSTKMRLHPASPGTGIRFRRTDVTGRPEVAAHVDQVISASRRTVLSSRNGATVETVEHLLAALAGLQIDNCLIEINSLEVPGVDGSCLPFCEAILQSGLSSQGVPRSVAAVDFSQSASDRSGEQWIEVLPSPDGHMTADYRLDYGTESPIPRQSLSIGLSPETFLREIAGARTFVLADEIETLQKNGFGRHLTGRDLLVFDADGSVIDNTLRWSDEPVRHKVLDCIGDLALSGRAFAGRIVARRSGHKLNHVMAKTLATMETGRSLLRAA